MDNEDEIEVILIDHEGHFLYKIIDGNKLLCPIIDFNLPQKVYNSIESKLKDKKIQDLLISAITKVYLEIFPKWDPETITIASNSDVKKISCHISTTGMRLKNIAQVVIFTELIYKKLSVSLQENSIINNIANKQSFFLRILGILKFNKKTRKNGIIFNFMLRSPNDRSKVVKSFSLSYFRTRNQKM